MFCHRKPGAQEASQPCSRRTDANHQHDNIHLVDRFGRTTLFWASNTRHRVLVLGNGQQLRPLDAPPALLYHAQKPLQRTRHHSTPTFSSSDDSEHKSPLKKYKNVATETCSTKSLSTKITRLHTLDGNCSAKKTVASLNSARNTDGNIDLTDAPDNTLCPIHAPASAPSLQRLYEVMEASIASQELLEDWDMQQGLPKSHSWTMMHSNRSRRQLLEGRILPKWNGKPLIGGGDVKANPTNSKLSPGAPTRHTSNRSDNRVGNVNKVN